MTPGLVTLPDTSSVSAGIGVAAVVKVVGTMVELRIATAVRPGELRTSRVPGRQSLDDRTRHGRIQDADRGRARRSR